MASTLPKENRQAESRSATNTAPAIDASVPRVKFAGYEQRRLRLMAEAVRGKTVLDVGHADLPNRYLGDKFVTGFDQKPTRDPSIRYDEEIVGDAESMHALLQGRTFDTILAGEIIEHLEEPYRFLRSMAPLLAPGGRLVLSTPNPLGFPVVLLEFLQSKRLYFTEDHTYYYLPRWLVRMAERSGYTVSAIKPVGLLLPLITIPWVPTIFSYQLIYILERRT